MTKHFERIELTNRFSPVKLIFRAVSFISFLFLFMALFPAEESKAKSPESDPWYYVEKNEIDFIVPDKFQHFYGSAILTEIAGPMPALAFGVLKEVHDDTDAQVGFSAKDLAADMLGIMSAKFARMDKVKLWLDWDPREETLIVKFGLKL